MEGRAVVLLLLCCVQCSLCLLNQAEKAALLEFLWTTGGGNGTRGGSAGEGLFNNVTWKVNTNWREELDPCDPRTRWYGVGCSDPCNIYFDGPNCYAGHIVSLELEYNNLVGTIPTSIGSFSQLVSLRLGNNKLEGPVPSEMANFQMIEVIKLNNNRLNGTLPNIRLVNSLGNALISEINVAHNQLTGELPTMPWSLKILNLAHNNFTMVAPIPLSDLSSTLRLQYLNIAYNSIAGNMPEGGTIFNISLDLRYFYADHNQITGNIPQDLMHLPKLNELHLNDNLFEGPIPLSITNLTMLRSLKLNNNRITGAIPYTIGRMSKLWMLDLHNNLMTGDVPSSIKDLGNLQYLYLQNEHYAPLRTKYCQQRLPDTNGKYSYRVVREQYAEMMAVPCKDMYSTQYTFNALPEADTFSYRNSIDRSTSNQEEKDANVYA